MKQAILFCRVSSKEQEESGYSLAAQEKLLRGYASKGGFNVKKVFSITESASGSKQRKAFFEMVDYAEKKDIRVIAVEKTDRLLRHLKYQVRIDEWMNSDPEREVHLVKEGTVLSRDSKSHEKFIWNIKVSVAQFYTDNLSEEVKKGQRQKISDGWLPTKPPLGYKTIGEKGKKIHVVDLQKASLVKRMFELYSTGEYSIRTVAKKIHQEGLRSHAGKQIPKSRVALILSDPFYYGKLRWNGEIYEGKQEPLISKGLYESVQTILKRKKTPKYGKHKHLFQGLIVCNECKGLITWEIQKGITYGHCNHYRNCTQKTWIKEEEINSTIASVLQQFEIKNTALLGWIEESLRESHKEEIEYHKSTIQEITSNYERVKNRLDKLYDDRLDGRIDEEFYSRKFKQYTDEKELASRALEGHSQADTAFLKQSLDLYELSQRAPILYQQALREEKRKLIKAVFSNLYVDEGTLSYSYTKAFDVLSKAVEVSNSSKVVKFAEDRHDIFELSYSSLNKEQNRALRSACPDLLRGRDSNPQPLR